MRRITVCVALAVLALGAVGALVPYEALGDQMICVPATDFLARSTLSHANASWQEIVDADALMDASMTAPGTSDTAGGPDRAWLVYRLPVPVDAAEATVAG